MRERGFSLIELLIVVAIILVISAIAIPSLMRARMAANEASATSSIRAINTAQTTYSITYSTLGYADNLAKLGAPASGPVTSDNAGLLDWVLGCASQPCPKSGYKFSIINVTGSPVVSSYAVTGVPSSIGHTGQRGFCSDKMNPVYFDPAGGTNCTIGLQ
ncbi:MAG TPA: type II secretion system protein [Clostridia bacterium]|nr:type II secretion system protein [Clostridia bacterium]